jgi:hypothetical protein
MKKIRFDSELTKELYTEVSALADTKKIDREYITLPYMWKIWKKVYRSNFGSTRHVYMPGELSEGDANSDADDKGGQWP